MPIGHNKALLHHKRAGGEPEQHYLNSSKGNINRAFHINRAFYKGEKPASDLTRGAATQAPRAHVKNIEGFKLKIPSLSMLSETYLAPCVVGDAPFW